MKKDRRLRFAYFTGEEPETVAESVTEFFEIFVRDAAQLWMFE